MIWEGLLVSVRDAAEATEALAGGARIVDVKEPARGALGAADRDTILAVARRVGEETPWTAACGELCEPDGAEAGVERVVALARALGEAGCRPPAALKAGLAGARGHEWARALRTIAARLPAGIGLVGVAYADAAAAPEPTDVIARAREIGCVGVLVDTHCKSSPGLFGSRAAAEIADWIAAAHRDGLPIALAGKLSLDDVAHAAALGADVVAVRSVACAGIGDLGVPAGDRRGRVHRERVGMAVARLRAAR